MTWHTEYHRPSIASIQDRQPYLSALLQTSGHDAELARRRLRNWLQTRNAERARPDVVDGMPYHVVLDPATICNLRCPLCVQATDPRGRKRGLVDVARYRDLIQHLTPHAIRLDLFNWGEPLLHPRFHQLVQLADAASIWTRASSNLCIRSGFVPERLVDAGLRYLVVSIDGATQAGYEKYRVRGDLSVVLANVAALIAARDRSGAVWPLVEWQFLALRDNVHELDDARRFAHDLGVDVFRYGGARGRMSTKLRLSTPANFIESADLLLDPSHPLSEYEPSGAKRRSSEREGCRWLWGKAVLNPDGGVAPCVSSWFREDDLGTWDSAASFDSIWNGPSYVQARSLARAGGDPQGTSICARCAYHRNFVPTPDVDDEPLPTQAVLSELADRLTEAGVQVSAAVRSALEQELAPGR